MSLVDRRMTRGIATPTLTIDWAAEGGNIEWQEM